MVKCWLKEVWTCEQSISLADTSSIQRKMTVMSWMHPGHQTLLLLTEAAYRTLTFWSTALVKTV